MFRPRQKSILEKSLLKAGVDLQKPLGNTLLKRMVERGHSEREVTFVLEGRSIVSIFDESDDDMINQLAQIEKIHEDGFWVVKAWVDGSSFDTGVPTVYSEYDLFGKHMDHV